jgi:DNA replication and repair protein RecF
MPVQTLSLTDFRSYPRLAIELTGGPHVVVGRNAAGKSNLVEALVLLSSGRSYRGGADTEMVRWGTDFARVGAAVESAGRIEELEVVVLAAAPGSGARKRVRVNGVSRRPAALAAALRTVLFAPEDMLLVSGTPSLRRNLLDALVAQREVTASATLATYARALTQRNSLLKRIREEAAGRAELVYWDGVICESGGQILDWRQAALAALADPLAAAHREIAPNELPVSLRYVSGTLPRPGEGWADALRRRLHETADKEVWNGATLAGPHRDDVAFEAGGRDYAIFASRGQQRTAILALKLAELEVLTQLDGRPPLLLLDDVFSELDPERRAHLVRRIGSLPQAIVTTTTADDLDPALVAASSLWQIEPGSARRTPQMAHAEGGRAAQAPLLRADDGPAIL